MFRSLHVRKRAAGAAGHTLMELMVIMALLAIAAWLLVPVTAKAYARFRLRLTADSIVQLMQQAKNRALFEGRTYLVVFPDSTARERDLILAREDGVSVRHLSFPIDISVSTRQADGDWSTDVGAVAFYPDGTSDGVQLMLQNAFISVCRIQLVPVSAWARVILACEVEP